MIKNLLSRLFRKARPARTPEAPPAEPQNDAPTIEALTAFARGKHTAPGAEHRRGMTEVLSLGCSAWDAIPAESPFRNPHVWLELQFHVSLRYVISLGPLPTPASRAGGEAMGLAAKSYAKSTGLPLPLPEIIQHFQVREQMLRLALNMAQTKDWLAAEYAGGMLFLLRNCLHSTAAGKFTLPVGDKPEDSCVQFSDGRIVPASWAHLEAPSIELKKCLQAWHRQTLEPWLNPK